MLPSPYEFERFLKAFEEGDIQVVVATEETVRGMDFPFIKRLFLTYVPQTPEDYLHLAGRVGQAFFNFKEGFRYLSGLKKNMINQEKI